MLTPTQRSILSTLGDCKSHSKEELRECIDGAHTTDGNLAVHIHLLRAKIEKAGYTISFSGGGYRLVKFASLPLDGLGEYLSR